MFCVSGLCGDSKMVLIFTSMPHSTVQRKYTRSRSLKARDTENVLEIFRNPGNSYIAGISIFSIVHTIGDEAVEQTS